MSGGAPLVAHATTDWWRPNRALATWLTWLLAANAVLQLALIPSDDATALVRYHRALDALWAGHGDRAQRLFEHAGDGTGRGALSLPVSLVGSGVLVLVIVWAFRSATNARALGRSGARLAPPWAIFMWFIPFANWVLPYLFFSDLWRSSDPATARGSGWRALSGSPLVRGWWAVRVAGEVAGFGSIGLVLAGVWKASPAETAMAVGHVAAAVAAVLLILVVRDITARQEALQLADPGPTSRPVVRDQVGVGADDSPGWKADPGGRYDHRYWDGSAWSEHVSTAGQPAIAPVTPPDWYPDPTTRFHWRYWTGHAWTEHVSRDGELFIDPIAKGSGDASDTGPNPGDPPPPA